MQLPGPGTQIQTFILNQYSFHEAVVHIKIFHSLIPLDVLEEIDDDLDEQGIVFVKLDDEVAKNKNNKQIYIYKS